MREYLCFVPGSRAVYFNEKTPYDFACIITNGTRYRVEIERFLFDKGATPIDYIISVAEVVDILSRCFPKGERAPSKRVVNAVYRSIYREETTPNPSILDVIDDPVFDGDGYSVNPPPHYPGYEGPYLIIGEKVWYDEGSCDYYVDEIVRVNVIPGEDGKIYLDYPHLQFAVSAKEMRSLIRMLKAIDEKLSTYSE